MNYFALFNLPEEYSLNAELLDQRFQLLQRITHPDKYANASDQEKRMYLQKNAEVNDAYHVLSSDVKRGEHLLEVRGTQLASEQETIGDTVFLMEQMELREQLADATNAVEIDTLTREISVLRETYKKHITELINNNTNEDNKVAAIELNKLKFLIKLADEAKHRKRTLSN